MFQDGAQQVGARPASAGIGRRLGARVVDGLVAIVLTVIVGTVVVVGVFQFGNDLGLSDDTLATLGDLILLFVLAVVLLGPFLAAAFVGVLSGLFGKGTGRTPGRRAFGLVVLDADDGQPSRGRATLHGVIRHLPSTLLFVGVAPVMIDNDAILPLVTAGALLLFVDLAVLITRDDHRALHDVVSGVTVARKQD